ncbi:MAG: protein kinase [Myxococcota bacterium]
MSERATVDFDATRTLLDTLAGDVEPEPETELGITVVEPERRLRLGALIGVGGMGEVREAEQQALARRVAVKGLVAHARSREATRRLLQEAWVTGALEHPNIVPVHDIDFESGEPRIVMKHVEGLVWGDLMDDPGAHLSVSDALEWNLRVLMGVCNAIEFAHSRGILHRDLKPDNVMVGGFGEVYVLDWGIAVSLAPRADGRIPLASAQTRAAGTPAYMAPEMLSGKGALLTERTDVYLLGGLLYRLVSGHAPRTGETLEDVLDAVVNEDPGVDPDWPLAELLSAALSRDPAGRPDSARAFREALEAHLEHRDARRLADAGLARLAELDAALRDTDPDRRALYDRFSAARFAVAEAQRRWPDIPGVAGPLRDATLGLATLELDRGDDRAADLLLAPLADVPDTLRTRLEALRTERQGAQRELARFKEDADPRTAMVPRLLVGALLALTWVVVPIGSVVLGVPAGYTREWSVSAGILVGTLGVMGALWPWFLRSRVNRTALVFLVCMPAFALIFLVGSWLAGLPAETAAALEVSVYLSFLVLATALVDWRLIFSVPAYLAAFLWGAWRPEHSLSLLGAANVVVALNIGAALLWPVLVRRS